VLGRLAEFCLSDTRACPGQRRREMDSSKPGHERPRIQVLSFSTGTR
jgi:hypothetical protein